MDIEAQFSINQSRADEITMREDYGTLPMSIHDDGFGDMGFDTDPQDLARDGLDPNMDDNLFGESALHSKEPIAGTSRSVLDSIGHPNPMDDGFGDEFGQPAAGLFEGDLFADAPIPSESLPAGAMTARSDSDDDMDGHFDGGAPSPCPSDNSRPASRLGEGGDAVNEPGQPDQPANFMNEEQQQQVPDPTTAALPEEESFALAPVDATTTAFRGAPKAKRKRKLIVDEVKNISGEEMKNQLANTSDIVTTLDLAPPTKRLMFWKETGGVEKLFGLPSREIPARCLFQNYQRNLTSRTIDLEDFSVLGPADVLALEYHQQRPESPKQRGRKRKLPMVVVPAQQMSVVPEQQEASLPEPDFIRDQQTHTDFLGHEQHELRPDGSNTLHSEVLMPDAPSIHGMASPNASLLTAGLPFIGGGMTPHHTYDHLESIPNLPVDQVSAVLNATEMGYPGYGDDHHQHHSPGNLSDRVPNDWTDDYDIPLVAGPVCFGQGFGVETITC